MPTGQHLWNELLSSKRRRDKCSIEKCLGYAMGGIKLADAGMWKAAEEGDSEEVRKWLHCLAQLLNVYAKLSIPGDLEQRLKALEAARSNGHVPAMTVDRWMGVDHA